MKTDDVGTSAVDTISSSIEPVTGDDFSLFVRNDEEAAVVQGPAILTTIKVSRPPKQSFVHFSPRPEHVFNITCLVYQDAEGGGFSEKAYYPILGHIAPLVEESVVLVKFALYLHLSGTPALWPINMRRDAKGELTPWSESAFTIITDYTDRWVRVVADKAASAYVVVPGNYNVEPKWPELTTKEIFELAFGKRLVKDESHPLVQHLLGKAA